MESNPILAKWTVQQSAVCQRFGAELVVPDLEMNSGVSANIIDGAWFNTGTWPLRGEHFLPTDTTTGWYVWAGENDESADYFKPVHTVHLETWCADAVPYLGLPSGWSFSLAPGIADVWFDEAFLVE
jgi:hypothetical protein